VEEEPEKHERQQGTTPLAWAIGGFVVLIAVTTALPMVLRQRKAADRTTAISHCKCIGLALLEFDQEFGSFPNEKTADQVKDVSGTPIDLTGSSSNAAFRQLIAFGIQSEIIFSCVHPEGIEKPDQDFSRGKALEAGEVGFSYICGLSTKMSPDTPVITAPMKIGTQTYWPDPYDNKAVVLCLDNSVHAPLLRRRDGKLPVANGKTLFENGPDTVWDHSFRTRPIWPENYTIDLRHPEGGR
jgi:hypothetical protein